MMRTTNLGNSGYLLFRPSKDGKDLDFIYKSTPQYHPYKGPYQCGTGNELPYQADDTLHPIEENDIVGVASHSMFENFDDSIPQIKNCLMAYYDKKTQGIDL